MNKKNLILLITVAFIIFTTLSLLKSSARTKIHDNHVFFTGIHNVSFTVKQHCISPGQPFRTPDRTQAGLVKHHKGKVGINIRAGRHGTPDTVDCVTTNMFHNSETTFSSSSQNFTFNQGLRIATPSKFNFAVKGTLAIDGKYFGNIILIQGHDGARNNWWFGGNECQKKVSSKFFNQKEQVNCTAVDGIKWCFLRGFTNAAIHNSPDHIKVEKKECTN